MTTIEVLKTIGEMGGRYKISEFNSIGEYIFKMLTDKRIVDIEGFNGGRAIIFFSICDDYDPFYKKDTWTYRPHFPDGNIAYIEKLISTKWDREMRELFENEILKHYPNAEFGVWHRFAKWGDRKVMRRRMKKHEYV